MKSVLLAAVVAFAVSACSGESTSPDVGKTGTYKLMAVNGGSLPAVTSENASIKTELLSGTLAISSDGTFSETRNGRVTLAGESPSPFTATQSGKWTESGGIMTFSTGTVANPVTFTGTWTPHVIVYTSSGVTLTYTSNLDL
jgi:hypothetical protein